MRKNKTKVFSLLLAATILLTQNCNFVFSDSDFMQTSPYYIKIDARLRNKMKLSGDNDKIPVWVWFRDIEEKEISEKMNEKGYDVSVYEDEDKFEKVIEAEIEDKVVEEFGYELAYSTGEAIKEYTDVENIEEENLSLVDLVISEKVDEYTKCKREVVKEICEKDTEKFIGTLVDEDDIIYDNAYSTTLVVEATKEEILDYAKQDDVEGISLYENLKVCSEGEIAFQQVGLIGTGGTKTSAYNGGKGYSGVNVKIGVLEATGSDNGAHYKSNDYMLKNIDNKSLFFVENYRDNGSIVDCVMDDHSTCVVKIIVGQSVICRNETYEGVVPNATVYQMPIEIMGDMLTGFEQLADLGVSVINMSFGEVISSNDPDIDLYADSYKNYEQELDKLIKNTGVTVVIAAGNEGEKSKNVTAPARCMNAITVGNAYTKGLALQPVYGGIYKMSLDSSYMSGSQLPNKPDIAAPGANIVFPISSTSFISDSGTSLAAPVVTGIIAQMMEARSYLKYSPNKVKSILFAAANPNKISAEDNAIVSNDYIRTKSGVGLVDAKKAINIAESSNDWGFYCPSALSTVSDVGENIYLRKGQKIRAVMVFDNPDGNTTSLADLDFAICDEDGATRDCSTSLYNNVEVIEYKVPYTGYYHFKVDGWRVKADTYCSYSWIIE